MTAEKTLISLCDFLIRKLWTVYNVVLKGLNNENTVIWLISRVTHILKPNLEAKVQVCVLRKESVSRLAVL